MAAFRENTFIRNALMTFIESINHKYYKDKPLLNTYYYYGLLLLMFPS